MVEEKGVTEKREEVKKKKGEERYERTIGRRREEMKNKKEEREGEEEGVTEEVERKRKNRRGRIRNWRIKDSRFLYCH